MITNEIFLSYNQLDRSQSLPTIIVIIVTIAFFQFQNKNRCLFLHCRKQERRADPYKRIAITLQTFGVIITLAGLLTFLCGIVVDWAKTFPLGDLTDRMVILRICGLVIIVIGVLLISASYLLYHKNDTGNMSVSKEQIILNIAPPDKQHTNFRNIRRISKAVNNSMILLAAVSVLAFCVGFINGWAETLPIRINSATKKVVGTLGIVGVVLSVTIMSISEITSTWLTKNILEAQLTAKNSHISFPTEICTSIT